jgi:hypothetical protein
MFSFLTIRKADESPAIVHAMKDLELNIARPSHIIKVGTRGTEVRLTPHEYEEYVKRIGKRKDGYGHDMRGALNRTFKSHAYQQLYKVWANPQSEHGKANVHEKMTEQMMGKYNQRKTVAKNSMISDFNLLSRARKLEKKFGSTN